MENTRRERGKNFTEKEKETAISIIDRYRHIIEDKATDGSSKKERLDAWQKIVDEYNATAVSAPRTVKQLKILWSNMRRMAKKTVAETNKRKYLDKENDGEIDVELLKRRKTEDKKNRSKTGGGQYESQLSEVEARVLAMVEPQARPLPNIYDDDNIYHGDLILSPTRGAILRTPSPTNSLNPEQILAPSYASTSFNPEVHTEDFIEHLERTENRENPSPVTFVPSRVEPQINRKKYVPPKQKIIKRKLTTAQLKRTLYQKRIQLANMEINFNKKMYELELKIKQRQLNGLIGQ